MKSNATSKTKSPLTLIAQAIAPMIVAFTYQSTASAQATSGSEFREVTITAPSTSTNELLSGAQLFLDGHRALPDTETTSLAQLESALTALEPTSLAKIRGYRNGRIWARIVLNNQTRAQDFILRYSYPSMQVIRVLTYDSHGALTTSLSSGKFVPPAERPLVDSEYLFPLTIPAGTKVYLVFMLDSFGSMQLPIQLTTSAKMHELTQLKSLMMGFYYGVVFLILAYSAFLFASTRSRLYMAYFAYVLSVVFAQMGLHGIAYQFLWPQSPWWNKVSTIFFVGMMFTFLTAFTMVVLETRKRIPRFHRVLVSFAGAALLVAISALIAYGDTVIKVTGFLTSILPIIVIPAGIAAWRARSPFAVYYLTGVFFYVIGASMYALKDAGLLAPNFVNENGILIGSLFEIIVFAIGIARQLQAMQTDTERMRAELSLNTRLSALAAQVSHDVRSPLSALNMVVGTLQGLPEEKRLIIRSATQRINDIANQLLQSQNRSKLVEHGNTSPKKIANEPVMLVSLIDSIVSEKRVQYREKHEIEIQANLNEGYGLFAKIDPTEFSRAISNLINNSVEAARDGACKIVVSLGARGEQAIITIADNGRGIPPEVLPHLGKRGTSHGKSGSGLGVHHAKTLLESCHGSFNIQSRLNNGTTVTMILPRSNAPVWFVANLLLRPKMTIVSLDDDQTIHQVWAGRMKSCVPAASAIKFLSFSSIDSFEKWLKDSDQQESLFLIDFEFIGQRLNGLQVVERLGIAKRALLVTSRFDERHVRDRALELGVKIIPKGLAPFVPIEIDFEAEVASTSPQMKYDAVIIDDDFELIHPIWKSDASALGKSVLCFTTPEDFMKQADQLDRSTPIFIDVNLGKGVRGEDIAERVSELGFKTISLATGYESESLTPPACVSRVVGKDPIWI